MSILDQAREAMAMIARGREALESIAKAVADGRTALNAESKAELQAMLERERRETKAAHAKLDEAIGRRL